MWLKQHFQNVLKSFLGLLSLDEFINFKEFELKDTLDKVLKRDS
jgi:hypothetical protein